MMGFVCKRSERGHIPTAFKTFAGKHLIHKKGSRRILRLPCFFRNPGEAMNYFITSPIFL